MQADLAMSRDNVDEANRILPLGLEDPRIGSASRLAFC